jgi:hypothetical protein
MRATASNLNAFTSDQLVKWLESKLEEYGVHKVMPDEKTLTFAYRRALQAKKIQELLDTETPRIEEAVRTTPIPPGLRQRLIERLAKSPELPWDVLLKTLVASEFEPDREGQ